MADERYVISFETEGAKELLRDYERLEKAREKYGESKTVFSPANKRQFRVAGQVIAREILAGMVGRGSVTGVGLTPTLLNVGPTYNSNNLNAVDSLRKYSDGNTIKVTVTNPLQVSVISAGVFEGIRKSQGGILQRIGSFLLGAILLPFRVIGSAIQGAVFGATAGALNRITDRIYDAISSRLSDIATGFTSSVDQGFRSTNRAILGAIGNVQRLAARQGGDPNAPRVGYVPAPISGAEALIRRALKELQVQRQLKVPDQPKIIALWARVSRMQTRLEGQILRAGTDYPYPRRASIVRNQFEEITQQIQQLVPQFESLKIRTVGTIGKKSKPPGVSGTPPSQSSAPLISAIEVLKSQLSGDLSQIDGSLVGNNTQVIDRLGKIIQLLSGIDNGLDTALFGDRKGIKNAYETRLDNDENARRISALSTAGISSSKGNIVNVKADQRRRSNIDNIRSQYDEFRRLIDQGKVLEAKKFGEKTLGNIAESRALLDRDAPKTLAGGRTASAYKGQLTQIRNQIRSSLMNALEVNPALISQVSRELGLQTSRGIVIELSKGLGSIKQAVKKITSTVDQTGKQGLKIKSPSGVSGEWAKQTVLGYVRGIDESTQIASSLMDALPVVGSDLSNTLTASLAESASNSATAFVSSFYNQLSQGVGLLGLKKVLDETTRAIEEKRNLKNIPRLDIGQGIKRSLQASIRGEIVTPKSFLSLQDFTRGIVRANSSITGKTLIAAGAAGVGAAVLGADASEVSSSVLKFGAEIGSFSLGISALTLGLQSVPPILENATKVTRDIQKTAQGILSGSLTPKEGVKTIASTVTSSVKRLADDVPVIEGARNAAISVREGAKRLNPLDGLNSTALRIEKILILIKNQKLVRQASKGTLESVQSSISMPKIGKDLEGGVLNGVDVDFYRELANRISTTFLASLTSDFEIGSPSRKMQKLFQWVTSGAEIGIKTGIPEVEKSAHLMAQAVIDQIKITFGIASPARVIKKLFDRVIEAAVLVFVRGKKQVADAADVAFTPPPSLEDRWVQAIAGAQEAIARTTQGDQLSVPQIMAMMGLRDFDDAVDLLQKKIAPITNKSRKVRMLAPVAGVGATLTAGAIAHFAGGDAGATMKTFGAIAHSAGDLARAFTGIVVAIEVIPPLAVGGVRILKLSVAHIEQIGHGLREVRSAFQLNIIEPLQSITGEIKNLRSANTVALGPAMTVAAKSLPSSAPQGRLLGGTVNPIQGPPLPSYSLFQQATQQAIVDSKTLLDVWTLIQKRIQASGISVRNFSPVAVSRQASGLLLRGTVNPIQGPPLPPKKTIISQIAGKAVLDSKVLLEIWNLIQKRVTGSSYSAKNVGNAWTASAQSSTRAWQLFGKTVGSVKAKAFPPKAPQTSNVNPPYRLFNALKDLQTAIFSKDMKKAEEAYNRLGTAFQSLGQKASGAFSGFISKIPIIGTLAGKAKGFVSELVVSVGGLIGAFTLADALVQITRSTFEAGKELERLDAVLLSSGSNADIGAKNLQFINGEISRLKLNAQVAKQAYGAFLTSIQGTPIEGRQGEEIFSTVSQFAKTRGVGSEQLERGFYALQQIAGGGTLQAEELNQLSEAIPGAGPGLIRGLGFESRAQLVKALKAGAVDSVTALTALQAELKATSGSVDGFLNNRQSALTDFQNSLFALQASIGDTFGPASVSVLQGFSVALDRISTASPVLVSLLATGLGVAVLRVASGFLFGAGAITKFTASFQGAYALFSRDVFGGLGSGIKGVGSAVQSLGSRFGGFLGQMALLTIAVETWSAAVRQLGEQNIPLARSFDEVSASIDRYNRIKKPDVKPETLIPQNRTVLADNAPLADQVLNQISRVFKASAGGVVSRNVASAKNVFGGNTDGEFLTIAERQIADLVQKASNFPDLSSRIIGDLKPIEKQIEKVKVLQSELARLKIQRVLALSQNQDVTALDQQRDQIQQQLSEAQDIISAKNATIDSYIEGAGSYIAAIQEALSRTGDADLRSALESSHTALQASLDLIKKTRSDLSDLVSEDVESVQRLSVAIKSILVNIESSREQLADRAVAVRTNVYDRALKEKLPETTIQQLQNVASARDISDKIATYEGNAQSLRAQLRSPTAQQLQASTGVDLLNSTVAQLTNLKEILGDSPSSAVQAQILEIAIKLRETEREIATGRQELIQQTHSLWVEEQQRRSNEIAKRSELLQAIASESRETAQLSAQRAAYTAGIKGAISQEQMVSQLAKRDLEAASVYIDKLRESAAELINVIRSPKGLEASQVLGKDLLSTPSVELQQLQEKTEGFDPILTAAIQLSNINKQILTEEVNLARSRFDLWREEQQRRSQELQQRIELIKLLSEEDGKRSEAIAKRSIYRRALKSNISPDQVSSELSNLDIAQSERRLSVLQKLVTELMGIINSVEGEKASGALGVDFLKTPIAKLKQLQDKTDGFDHVLSAAIELSGVTDQLIEGETDLARKRIESYREERNKILELIRSRFALVESMVKERSELLRNRAEAQIYRRAIADNLPTNSVSAQLAIRTTRALEEELGRLRAVLSSLLSQLKTPDAKAVGRQLGIDLTTATQAEIQSTQSNRGSQFAPILEIASQAAEIRNALAAQDAELARSQYERAQEIRGFAETANDFNKSLSTYFENLQKSLDDARKAAISRIQQLKDSVEDLLDESLSIRQNSALTRLKTALVKTLLDQTRKLVTGTNGFFEEYLQDLSQQLEALFNSLSNDREKAKIDREFARAKRSAIRESEDYEEGVKDQINRRREEANDLIKRREEIIRSAPTGANVGQVASVSGGSSDPQIRKSGFVLGDGGQPPVVIYGENIDSDRSRMNDGNSDLNQYEVKERVERIPVGRITDAQTITIEIIRPDPYQSESSLERLSPLAFPGITGVAGNEIETASGISFNNQGIDAKYVTTPISINVPETSALQGQIEKAIQSAFDAASGAVNSVEAQRLADKAIASANLPPVEYKNILIREQVPINALGSPVANTLNSGNDLRAINQPLSGFVAPSHADRQITEMAAKVSIQNQTYLAALRQNRDAKIEQINAQQDSARTEQDLQQVKLRRKIDDYINQLTNQIQDSINSYQGIRGQFLGMDTPESQFRSQRKEIDDQLEGLDKEAKKSIEEQTLQRDSFLQIEKTLEAQRSELARLVANSRGGPVQFEGREFTSQNAGELVNRLGLQAEEARRASSALTGTIAHNTETLEELNKTRKDAFSAIEKRREIAIVKADLEEKENANARDDEASQPDLDRLKRVGADLAVARIEEEQQIADLRLEAAKKIVDLQERFLELSERLNDRLLEPSEAARIGRERAQIEKELDPKYQAEQLAKREREIRKSNIDSYTEQLTHDLRTSAQNALTSAFQEFANGEGFSFKKLIKGFFTGLLQSILDNAVNSIFSGGFGNAKDGATVTKAGLTSFATARNREGPDGVMIFATPGEEVLSDRKKEASNYRRLEMMYGDRPLQKILSGEIGSSKNLMDRPSRKNRGFGPSYKLEGPNGVLVPVGVGSHVLADEEATAYQVLRSALGSMPLSEVTNVLGAFSTGGPVLAPQIGVGAISMVSSGASSPESNPGAQAGINVVFQNTIVTPDYNSFRKSTEALETEQARRVKRTNYLYG